MKTRMLNYDEIIGKRSAEDTPDLNYFYSVSFMIICLAFNTIMLYPIHRSVFSSLSYYDLNTAQLQAGHFALVGSNCLLSLRFNWAKRVEYLGQVNMLALLVILCLLPLTFISMILPVNEWMKSIYMLLVAIFIFREYLRRMEYLGILTRHKWLVSFNIACLIGFILYLFGS